MLLLILALCWHIDSGGLQRLPAEIYYLEDANPPSDRWRVGVLGDSQKGLANLRNIAREVAKQAPRVFLHTGDLVSNNDEGHYRLAYMYLLSGYESGVGGLPHIAPGNHDLKGGAERFAKWCGPLEQSFTKHDVAFVILDNAHGQPPDPKHIEDRIAAAGAHKAVVLAMHQPPFDIQGNPKSEYAAFLAWLEKSGIAYLMCGHEHGYLKKKVGETTVIINGVGGDYDKWQLDQKVYATILEVDGSKIADRRIEIEPAHEIWENIQHAAIGHVAEAYRRKPLLCWAGTLLLLGGVGWGWVKLIRRNVSYW
jgi:hypothetical protein